MKGGWTESYYDALEFFYYEPNHIGKIKYIDSKINTVEKMRDKLSKMEVVLNHHFDFFLRIAPDSFRNNWFSKLFSKPFCGKYKLHDRTVGMNFWGGKNVTQPDIFFEYKQELVSIEMKINEKSSIEQFIKYCLLGLAYEKYYDVRYSHYLAFIGKGSFEQLWREKFADVSSLKQSITMDKINDVLTKCKFLKLYSAEKLYEICQRISVGYMSYGDFVDFLVEQKNKCISPDDAYANLIDGLVNEISQRKIV